MRDIDIDKTKVLESNMLLSLYIVNRAGTLVFHRNLNPSLPKLSSNEYLRVGIPHPDAEIVWMHFPFIINEKSPFSRKEVQTYFELRGIQTRPPFSGNIINQPMMKDQNYIANDSYDNANDMMKNGILIGCHQGLSLKNINYIHDKIYKFLADNSK